MTGAAIAVRDGCVHLPAALVEAHFAGVEAVVVLVRDGALEVLPVRHVAAGGCLLKRRNAAGDRVAAAPDALRACGLGEWRAGSLAASWSAERAALVAPLPEDAKILCNTKNE